MKGIIAKHRGMNPVLGSSAVWERLQRSTNPESLIWADLRILKKETFFFVTSRITIVDSLVC